MQVTTKTTFGADPETYSFLIAHKSESGLQSVPSAILAITSYANEASVRAEGHADKSPKNRGKIITRQNRK